MSYSLVGRLLLRLTLVTLLALAIAFGAFLYRFLEEADTLRDRNLTGQLADLTTRLSLDDTGTPRLDLPATLAQAYAASRGMFRYAVADENGRVLLASHEPKLLGSTSPPSSGRAETFRADLFEAGNTLTYYGAARLVRVGDRLLRIEVAQGPAHGDVLADEFLEELWEGAGYFILGLFVLLGAVIYVTLRRAMAPLQRASAEASAIGPNRTDLRLSEDGLPSEIGPLVTGMNQALDRLASGYAEQKRFTADAAHELRTPIAVLRAHLDTLDDPATRKRLLPDIDRLERIVQQLLLLRQADNLTLPSSAPADLAAVARDTLEMLGPLFVRQGRNVELVGAERPVHVRGDAAYLELAVRNLVENALASSPAEGLVTVTRHAPADLSVADSGPGVSPEQRERIFERFWRGRSEPESGAGLGLSIVRRIAEVHDGSVSVGDSPGGGALFTLHLRPATAS